MMELGSVEDKWQAMEDIKAIAFQSRVSASTNNASDDGRTITETVIEESASSENNDCLEEESEESLI
jgi:hypothetical protein